MATIRREAFVSGHRKEQLSLEKLDQPTKALVEKADLDGSGKISGRKEMDALFSRIDRLEASGDKNAIRLTGAVANTVAALAPAFEPFDQTPSPSDPLAPLTVTFRSPERRLVGPAVLPSESIAGVPVQSATTYALDVRVNGSSPTTAHTVEVQFGTLTEEQFRTLHAEFGGRSQVTFNAARRYELIDFLPPSLQAIVNTDVTPPSTMVKLEGTASLGFNRDEEDVEVDLSLNCHGTTWEAARAYQGAAQAKMDVGVFVGDTWLVGDASVDPTLFNELGSAGKDSLSALLPKLKAGDVVFMHEQHDDGTPGLLLHSVTAVGGGLFLDKADLDFSDGSYDYPVRLVTLQTSLDAVELAKPEADRRLVAVARRPVSELPTPESAFALEGLEDWKTSNGITFGKPLLTSNAIGSGGGISGQYGTALERWPLVIDERGRGRLLR